MRAHQSTTTRRITSPFRCRLAEKPIRPNSLLLACLGALLLGYLPSGRTSLGFAGFRQPSATHPAESTNPVANWLEDVIRDLEDLEETLRDAEEAIGGQPGPLSEPELSRVAGDLEAALVSIDHALPLLEPANAGSIDNGVNPGTLPGYAGDCLDLAKDAVDEANSTVPDAKVIGGHLQTIEHLITRATPHNYRSLAGIN